MTMFAEKSRCRLCEVLSGSAGGQIIGSDHQLSPSHPSVPAPFNVFLPQLRDMMLAAWFLRGGYYQPAGPLISTHHHHHHSTSSSVTSKLQPPPTPSSLPTPTPPPSTTSAPHGTSESSDSEVVLTSASDNPPPPPPVTYRYPPHGGQPYNYGYNYYPAAPAGSLQYPGQPSHYHQEICYPAPSGYPPGYFPKGHYPPPPAGYPRRYPPHQYYPPQDFYQNPPPNSSVNPQPASNSQMMVPAPAAPGAGQTSSSYPPADNSYPPPAPMVEPYPPPPPQPYYPGYSAGPPPPCYSTHSPSRQLFLDPAYQGCPCPMQSCPKNVHTGPLTGASKGSMKNHQTTPLPPVALALPLEPPGALGPPSPARGSAGMPPPPSPALATARNPPQSPPVKGLVEQTGLLAIGKMVTDAVMLADQVDTSIITAELIPKTEPIKQEIEDIIKIETIEEVKCNRKRRKSLKSIMEIKRQAFETICETEMKMEVQDRLITPKEEPDKIVFADLERVVEKQLPLSDSNATPLPVKNNAVTTMLNGMAIKDQLKKRKSVISDSEPPVKIAKCVKSPKVQKKCVKRNKSTAEENIAPEHEPVSVEVANVACRRNSKAGVAARRKSSCSPAAAPEETRTQEEDEAGKKKKAAPARSKKVQEKTKADHLLRSHGKSEAPAVAPKERRLSKAGSTNSDRSPVRGGGGVVAAKKAAGPGTGPVEAPLVDPSAESQVCLPGLRRTIIPKWSNGWSWEGTPYKAKIFLNEDGAVVRTCYPAMRHIQGDTICPRDCVLLKSGPRKIDLPFVAKVAAMWENPDDGEMMVSLLWYYRPEHTEQGRRLEDIPDEIFASRHKDTNSVACIEDKCFVLTFNEYCRYRKAVRQLEEGLSQSSRVVPAPDGGSYPRDHRQPPGRVAPDLVFFCRRVYDFRQKRILKNPC